jgi:hypothetical protein
MFGGDFRAMYRNPAHPHDARSVVTAGQRRIALVANGRRHGPITRLITPWDIGELTRPFVLLNYVESKGVLALWQSPTTRYQTLASCSLRAVLRGHDRQTGRSLRSWLRWMKTGSTAGMRVDSLCTSRCECSTCGFHARAPTACAAASECVALNEVEQEGPVRVLGEFGRARGRLRQAPQIQPLSRAAEGSAALPLHRSRRT